MLDVKDYSSKYQRWLPKTENFKIHAITLAWDVACGNVERVKGYLDAMGRFWRQQSKKGSFKEDQFQHFAETVIHDAEVEARKRAAENKNVKEVR